MNLSPHERRRRIVAVLNPRGVITYAHLERAVSLAVLHAWNVEPVAAGQIVRAAPRSRTIYTTPIWGDAELAVFAHEGGHIEDRDDAQRPQIPHPTEPNCYGSIEGEVAAWRWAMAQLGWRWNDTMQSRMADCLSTYGKEFGYGWCAIGAVIDEGRQLARHVVRCLPVSDAHRAQGVR